MVSIIVPVYNCGEYLSKCVESVLAQTYTDFELILVDDGSFDGSSQLCDLWAESDSRIQVIHQKNAGVSAARNAGMDAATGEMLTFIDADDYYVPKTLETLLESLGNADMVMYDLITVWANGGRAADTIPRLPESCMIEKKDWYPALLAQMAGSACRCLYRRELVEDIRFPVGIKLSEDRLFNLAAMGRAEKLNYLKKGLYMRTIREGSACFSYHPDYFENNLRAAEVAEEIIKNCWSEEYLPEYRRMFLIQGALLSIYQVAGRSFDGKSRLAAIREITSHPALETAFALCPPEGLREKLLKAKANLALLAVGVAFNIKNGR